MAKKSKAVQMLEAKAAQKKKIAEEDSKPGPLETIRGITFLPIRPVKDVEIAFGIDSPNTAYFQYGQMPNVPIQYEQMAEKLFYEGGKFPLTKEGIDRTLAARWTRAMLTSFAPKQQEKIRTVGYAFWLWDAVPNEEQ